MALPVFLRKFDWVLTSIILGIMALGLATFFAMGPNSHAIFVRHALFVGLGLLVMLGVSFFDYRIFKNYTLPAILPYALALILLALALASREIRGSSAWLEIGGFQFEPSEFAKLALLILFAKYFSQKHSEMHRISPILISGIYVSIPLLLTLLQPDLGSVIVYSTLWIAMLLFAGVQKKHLLGIFMIGVITVSLGWFLVLKPYQKSRIVSFINPQNDPRGSGYNTIQSRITLGSGGLFGTYPTGNHEKIPVVVPEPYTDFTFAAFAQKFGFLGVSVLLITLILFCIKIGKIATSSRNNFGRLFCWGYLVIIFTHVIINAGMNVGLLPITGIPFPFVSHGGSHLVTIMAGLGIIQSINRWQ